MVYGKFLDSKKRAKLKRNNWFFGVRGIKKSPRAQFGA